MKNLSPSMQKKVERIFHHTWYYRREAPIIAAISGSISAAASTIVMSITLRSQSKLSSPYHRIMFFMSFWDAIGSIAMALATVPMPADVSVIYPFSGKSYGSAGTCAAQGFVILLGQSFTICTTIVLTFYYIFNIRFGMTDDTANRRLLPISLIISCLISLAVAGIPLRLGLINPRPFDTHCWIGLYPWDCHHLGLECIGGADVSEGVEMKVVYPLVCLICFAFLVTAALLVLAVMAVRKTEQQEMEVRSRIEDAHALQIDVNMDMDMDMNGNHHDHNHNHNHDHDQGHGATSNRTAKDFYQTRAARRLALMYIGAFVITWIWSVFGFFFGWARFSKDYSSKIESVTFWYTLSACRQTFQPMQGLFNALIFIYNKMCLLHDSHSKVHEGNHESSNPNNSSGDNDNDNDNDDCNRNRNHPRISFLFALKTVIMSPSVVPEVLLSNIEFVEEKNKEIQREKEHIEQMLADEAEEEGMSEISPADIPSSFESLRTPSFDFSNAMISVGNLYNIHIHPKRDKEEEECRENGGTNPHPNSNSNPPKKRSFYTYPTDMFDRSITEDDHQLASASASASALERLSCMDDEGLRFESRE